MYAKRIVIDSGIWASLRAGRKYQRSEWQGKISRVKDWTSEVTEKVHWKDQVEMWIVYSHGGN